MESVVLARHCYRSKYLAPPIHASPWRYFVTVLLSPTALPSTPAVGLQNPLPSKKHQQNNRHHNKADKKQASAAKAACTGAYALYKTAFFFDDWSLVHIAVCQGTL